MTVAAASPVLPSVLAPPTAPTPSNEAVEPVAEPAAPAAEPGAGPGQQGGPGETTTAPGDSAGDAPRRGADLNERLLLEAMAGSAPRGPASADDAAPAASGPITARAAPAASAARAPVETIALPTEPQSASEAEPVRVRPAPSRVAAVTEETPARLTAPVPPVYPNRCESRARDEETVTVRFNVSRFGKVTGPVVTASSNGCFDRAALAAVSRFGFEPATRDGRPVAEGDRTTRVVFRKP